MARYARLQGGARELSSVLTGLGGAWASRQLCTPPLPPATSCPHPPGVTQVLFSCTGLRLQGLMLSAKAPPCGGLQPMEAMVSNGQGAALRALPFGSSLDAESGRVAVVGLPVNTQHSIDMPAALSRVRHLSVLIGATELASDHIRLTLGNLPGKPKLTGFPPEAWRSANVTVQASSVAEVDACTAYMCYYFEEGGDGSGGGSLHLRARPGGERAGVLGADGNNAGLLEYPVRKMGLVWK